ncbi:MAG: hypothetical protein GWP17_03970 [Aquificales bacterium]|nr:hypothetical protein [Aquificales bacterium]
MNRYRKLLGVFVVLVLVMIVGITAVALAQDEEPLPPPEPEVTAPILPGDGFVPPQGDRRDGGRGRGGSPLFTPEEKEAALAAELGITVEELDAAREAAHATLIQQAVTDGKITQDQADQILSGEFNRREFLGDLRQTYLPQETVHEVMAGVLNMTVEELDAAIADGKRLPEIAEEQGVEMTAIVEAVQAAFAEAVAQAVADGVITQDQADRLLSRDFRPGGQRGFDGPRGGSRGGSPRGGGQG